MRSFIHFTKIIVISTLCCYALVACHTDKQESSNLAPVATPSAQSPQLKSEADMQPKPEEHTGYIIYKPLEGGFYAFENQKGARFTLMGLSPEHKRNGLKVTIQGVRQPDMMTITQYGVPFILTDLTVLDDSGVSDGEHM